MYLQLFLLFYFAVVESMVSKEEAMQIGSKIWQNESGGTVEGLLCWNKGEEFASLGVGHFIWHPHGSHAPFKESFPALLQFFKKEGVLLPAWLEESRGCVWQNKEIFEASRTSKEMKELGLLLAEHVDMQIVFMAERLKQALPALLKELPENKRAAIAFQFHRIAASPGGLYVLMDYLNFKGEGLSLQERYQGKGWGLLQVLEQLEGKESDLEALSEFVAAAKMVLTQRVASAPPERNEKRWLPGWFKRLETYAELSH